MRTSEFWVTLIMAIASAIAATLVQFKVIPSIEVWEALKPWITSGVTYVVGRLISKFVKAVFIK